MRRPSRMQGTNHVQRPKSGYSQGHRIDLLRLSERDHLRNAAIRKAQSSPARERACLGTGRKTLVDFSNVSRFVQGGRR